MQLGTQHTAERGSGRRQVARAAVAWIDELTGDVLRSWRERVTARQVSRVSLRIYHEVQGSRPELSGVSRYVEIVARQTGLDELGVQEILGHAEESFASWPVERPLQFRDIVLYIVARQCLDADTTVPGIRSHLGTIVAEEIPAEL